MSGGVRGGEFNGNSLSGWNAYPELIWEIDFWGKYRRSTEAARAELLASQYGQRTLQMSLISAVASTYFQLLDYRLSLAISERTLTSRDSGLTIIQARYDYGVVPEIDLNQSQIQREISAVAVPAYTRYIALTDLSVTSCLISRSHSGSPMEYHLSL